MSQLPAESDIPQWAVSAQGLLSVTRRDGELSLVTLESAVPDGVKSQGGWRLFELEGPFDFALTGILLSVLRPLADVGIGIFALSTYDTDAILVQEQHLDRSVEALKAAGHHVAG